MRQYCSSMAADVLPEPEIETERIFSGEFALRYADSGEETVLSPSHRSPVTRPAPRPGTPP